MKMQNVDQSKESSKIQDAKASDDGLASMTPSSSPILEKTKVAPESNPLGSGEFSASDEDEVSEVDSFILDQEDDIDDGERVLDAANFLLPAEIEAADLRTVDPETQARLEALLEAAGIGKLSTADPEVLRRLTSSVSCALDEAAAALTRMRAEQQGQVIQGENARSLAEACSDGDIGTVRKLLDEGRSVHETTEEGESLLSLACSAGYYELAQVLLAMRANVEDRGIKGDCTPLMEAASGGYVEIVKLLIHHGADVNAQSSAGNTPLHYGACGGYVYVVQELIDAGANVEEHNENGHTPLMEAASAGHVGVANVLLASGAGINTHSNEFKESALTLACYKGHLEMVKFLLEAGADQEHKTDEMHTALMEASMDGHVEVARLLLDSGAQVNMPPDSFESPLTLAACGGHVELANLLIERGANLEEVNDEGYTPLMEAAREGHEEMVALLLAHGAEINAQTEETQETALTLACCGGFLEVADFLIKAGGDIELGCSTPLMEAAQEGHLELVKYLLEKPTCPANVHAQTGTGDTALTYACENGHTDVADVLLQKGAELEHESEGGRTPLMKAARAGHLCTVQFLISKGADVNRATSTNDHTVLSLACAGGHLAVVELLLTHGADSTHKLKDGSTMLIEAAKGGHTAVVNLLLDYPNTGLSPTSDLTQLTPPDTQVNLNELPRVPMQGLNNIVPPQDPNQVGIPQLPMDGVKTTTNFTPIIPTVGFSQVPGQLNLKDFNIPAKTPEQIRQNMQKSLQRNSTKANNPRPNETEQMKNSMQASESDTDFPFDYDKNYPEISSPVSLDLDEQVWKTSEKCEKLEALINNMMRKAEMLNTTREEQLLKKQQILEELQKVERELQEKAQVHLLLSAQQRMEQEQLTLGSQTLQQQPYMNVQQQQQMLAAANALQVADLPKPVPIPLHAAVQKKLEALKKNKAIDTAFEGLDFGSFSNMEALNCIDSDGNLASSSNASSNLSSSNASPMHQIHQTLASLGGPQHLAKQESLSSVDSASVSSFEQALSSSETRLPPSDGAEADITFQALTPTERESQDTFLNDHQSIEDTTDVSQLQFLDVSHLPLPDYSQDSLKEDLEPLPAIPIHREENGPPVGSEDISTETYEQNYQSRASSEEVDLSSVMPVPSNQQQEQQNEETECSAIESEKELMENEQLEEAVLLEQLQQQQPMQPQIIHQQIITQEQFQQMLAQGDQQLVQQALQNLPLQAVLEQSVAVAASSALDQQHVQLQRQQLQAQYLLQQQLQQELQQLKLQPEQQVLQGQQIDLHQLQQRVQILKEQQTAVCTQSQAQNQQSQHVSTSTIFQTMQTVQQVGGQPLAMMQASQTQQQQLQLQQDLQQQLKMQQLQHQQLQQQLQQVQQSQNSQQLRQQELLQQTQQLQVQLQTAQQLQHMVHQQVQQQKQGGPQLSQQDLLQQAQQLQQQLAHQQKQLATVGIYSGTQGKKVKKGKHTLLPTQQQQFQQQPQNLQQQLPQPLLQGQQGQSQVVHSQPINSYPVAGVVQNSASLENVTPPPSTPLTPNPSPASPQISPPGYPNMDLDAQTESNHDTALTLACAGGHSELVSLLLGRGADIEHRDKKGFTPLILAATAGHSDVVEILLDHAADIEAQSERTKDTPLSLACSGGRYEVVELLLARGANKEHRNVSDYTPLSLAASGGYVNIIKLLLSHGAEINSRTGSKLGISPLMLAAMNGHTAAVKLLLDMGSDINAQIETNRNTALTLACFQGRHEVVSLLVDRKANIEHRAKTGLTPLMEAASGGYVEVGRVLLDKGADVNAPPVPSSRDTALTIAADKGHYRFVELLLLKAAAVDVKNKKGNSPLWLACNGGHLDVVQLLVNAGADIDSQDNRKVSCLMSAFRKGHVKVVKWMVKHVMQFPSDQECMRYIATLNDKELLKKCHQCMEIIVSAKDRQAAEANKNASILLEELDMEKSREESKKAAAARKREKRRKKKKEKQEKEMKEKKESSKNSSPEPESNNNIQNSQDEDEEVEEKKDNKKVETEPERAPPVEAHTPIASTVCSTTTTTTTKSNSESRSEHRRNMQHARPESSASSEGRRNRERRNKKEKSPCETPATAKKSSESNLMNNSASNNSANNINSGGRKKKTDIAASISSTGIGDLDDFGMLPPDIKVTPITSKEKEKNKKNVLDQKSRMSSLDTFGVPMLSPIKNERTPVGSVMKSPGVPSPKRGSKKEEGWKEVIRKSKKVPVPAAAISRVIGRAGSNINAIREVSGAHIEVDKQRGDRLVTIKGSADATRQAVSLINALVKDPDKELEQLLPKVKAKSLNNTTNTDTFTASVWHNSMANNIGITTTTSVLQSPSVVTSIATSKQSKRTTRTMQIEGTTNLLDGFPEMSRAQTGYSNIQPGPIPAWSNTTQQIPLQSSPMHPGTNIGTIPAVANPRSPSAVSRKLFHTEAQSVSGTVVTTVVAKTTVTYSTASMTKTRVTSSSPTFAAKVDVKALPNGTKRSNTPVSSHLSTSKFNPVPGGANNFSTKTTVSSMPAYSTSQIIKPDPQPLPIKTSMPTSQLQNNSNLTVSQGISVASTGEPAEYSPFNNLFSSQVTDRVLGKKDDPSESRMNFASVAAAGVLPSSLASAASSVVSVPIGESRSDPSLPAKAPGYKAPGQRTSSPQINEMDFSKAPGDNGNYSGMSPPLPSSDSSARFAHFRGPLGVGIPQNMPPMAANQMLPTEFDLIRAQGMKGNFMPVHSAPMHHSQAHGAFDPMDLAKNPAFHGPANTSIPPPRFHSRHMLPSHGTMHAQRNLLTDPQHSVRDEYSTPHQPMTLPKIESTLNPNAPDFTVRNRQDLQQSHLSGQGISPGLQGDSQMFMQQAFGGRPLAGFGSEGGNFPSNLPGISNLMSALGAMPSLGSGVPKQYSPVPSGRPASATPSAGTSSRDEASPVSPVSGDCSPGSSNAPSPHDNAKHTQRPFGTIGGERVHRKTPNTSMQGVGEAGGASSLWGYQSDLEWLTNVPPMMTTSVVNSTGISSDQPAEGSSGNEDRPGGRPLGQSFPVESSLMDSTMEQAFQSQIGGQNSNAPSYVNGLPGAAMAHLYTQPPLASGDGVANAPWSQPLKAGAEAGADPKMWNSWTPPPSM